MQDCFASIFGVSKPTKGRFVISKTTTDSDLLNVPFVFNYTYTVDSVVHSGSYTLHPGQASSPSLTIPLFDNAGNPVPVTVTESANGFGEVSNISVSNGTVVSSNLITQAVTFYVGTGTTLVTFQNTSDDTFIYYTN